MGRIRVIVAEGLEGSAEPSGLLRAVLEHEGVEVVGEVLTLFELIQLAADEQPDAVVSATQLPQPDLDRLRRVAPTSKIVFVSPILTAAEAEMAEAVVERADVLASLGPVLVHLCTPGRINARRAITEGFDRPDWIDRVRKDPITLREILSEAPHDDAAERPSITSLQGEVRAAGPPAPKIEEDVEEDVVLLPDLEAQAASGPQQQRRRRHDDPPADPDDAPVVIPPARRRRTRRLGLWSLALLALGITSVAVLPSTVPVALVAAPGEAVVPIPVDGGGVGEGPGQPRRDPGGRDAGGGGIRTISPDGHTTDGGAKDGGANGGANAPGAPAGGGNGPGSDGHDGGGGGDPAEPDAGGLPGSSAQHNPHGGPPGQTGEHPEPGGTPTVH